MRVYQPISFDVSEDSDVTLRIEEVVGDSYSFSLSNNQEIWSDNGNDGLDHDRDDRIFFTYNPRIEIRDTGGNVIASEDNPAGYDNQTFGGIHYKDGEIYTNKADHESNPSVCSVLVFDENDISQAEQDIDISTDVDFGINAIWYYEGYWFIGETACGEATGDRSIHLFDEDWNHIKKVWTEADMNCGWQCATVRKGLFYVPDHGSKGVFVFRFNRKNLELELLYILDESGHGYSQGIASADELLGENKFLIWDADSNEVQQIDFSQTPSDANNTKDERFAENVVGNNIINPYSLKPNMEYQWYLEADNGTESQVNLFETRSAFRAIGKTKENGVSATDASGVEETVI